MIDQDTTNELILEDLVADFDGFLKERRWDDCNAIIDNLGDMGEYTKGIELAKRLCAAKLRVPDGYGDELEDFNDALRGLKNALVVLKEEETVY